MRSSVLLFTFIGLLNFFCETPTFASAEPYWNWRNPVPQGNDYNEVAYGSGHFVAVGRAGTITTSVDGVTWSAANSGLNAELSSIAYGNGRFVVVGYGVPGALISDDGVTWTLPVASLPDGWKRVTAVTYTGGRFYASSNGTFVATLGQNFVATSTDGVNWTNDISASTANVGRIAFAGGGYVAQDMSTGIAQSPDGIGWTIVKSKMLRSPDGITWASGGETGLADITAGPVYLDGRWVIGGRLPIKGSDGSQQFVRALSTSNDGGTTWSVAWSDSITTVGGSIPPDGLAVFGGRLFFTGFVYQPISSTADFVTVRQDLPMQIIQLKTFATTTDRIVAVGRYGQIQSSSDGVNWTSPTSTTVQGNLRGAAFGDGQWLLAGDAGLVASPDGITWTMLASSSSFNGGSVAYGNGRFVASDISGRIAVSTDRGATWIDSSKKAGLQQIAFAHDRFVGAPGLVSSPDGLNWSADVPVPGGAGHWLRICVIDDVFYAVGTTDPMQEKNGIIARSDDGLSWTVVATMSQLVESVGGKNGLLVACGEMGEIWTSNDGLSWQQADGRPLFFIGPAATILWVGDSLVAATLGGQILLSDDGITWAKDEFASSGTIFGLAAGNGQVLAFGAGGVIWEVGAARFTRQPESRTVAVGSSVTLSASAVGKEPLSYQWQKNGASIAGAKSRSFTISPAQITDAGNYRVVVSNSLSSATSGEAALAVKQMINPPSITSQPQSSTVNAGASVTFSVTVTGDAPLIYQWRKDNAAISGATGSTYTIPAVTPLDNGIYMVAVSNTAGTVTSMGATLTVNAPAARLVNIATRAYATTGNGVTIGGFVVSGSTAKRVLVRAVGPSLTAQGMGAGEVLADPTVDVYSGSTVIASNDNWTTNSNAAEISSVSSQIGAAALLGSDDKSSALLLTLNPGVYTFVVHGTNNTSGIVLLEVYDAESATASRFVNIATRAMSTTGSGVAIGGFVVSGNAAKQILIRAIGPSLAAQGIDPKEVLADPMIELHDASHGNVTIATNDNWTENSNAADIATVGNRIGAAAIGQADTKSSALLLTLNPGVYTFVASGKSSTSGIVLVEVYDAD